MSARIYFVLLVLSFAMTLYGQTAKQIELLKQYAKKGNAACSYRLAEFARAGKLSKSKKVNDSEYNHYFNLALKARYPKARLDLAVSYLNDNMLRNQHMAYDILNELLNVPVSRDFTKEDLFETSYWVGHCLDRGIGCAVNVTTAYFYYRFASIGNTKARLAILWRLGREKDKNIPLNYLYKICLDDNSPDTLKNIHSFLNQYNLNNDFAAYLEQKALAGDGAACKILAENQWNGYLFASKQKTALKNFERAAQLGDVQAALKLAEIYSRTNLDYIKGIKRVNLYSSIKSPVNLDKAEYYAKQALHSDQTRNDAALMMIQLIKRKLQRFKTPPANAGSVELPEISKSGPPLPPVPGQVIPAGRLNKMALAPAVIYRQLRNELFYYYMLINDYKSARKVLDEDGGDGLHAKDLYLKAKEFRVKNDFFVPAVRTHYRDRLRMAANAGYPLAIYEYYLWGEFAGDHAVNYSKLIEAALQMPYPDQSQWHWNLGQWFMQPGPDRNPAQALACISKAAEMGEPDALEYLMISYRDGNPVLKLARNNAQAEKYHKLLLKHDTRMTKPVIFAKHLQEVEPDQKFDPDDFNILFRAVGHSPLATYKYAQIYFTGNKSLKITKNADFGLNLLHFAVQGNMTSQSVSEIQKRYPQIIGVSDVSKLMHYEQQMLPLYKAVR